VCGSLREALLALHKDRAFLTKGDVFSDDQIDAYMELKVGRAAALGDDAQPGRVRHVLFCMTLSGRQGLVNLAA
jgi:glutamine synthetase